MRSTTPKSIGKRGNTRTGAISARAHLNWQVRWTGRVQVSRRCLSGEFSVPAIGPGGERGRRCAGAGVSGTGTGMGHRSTAGAGRSREIRGISVGKLRARAVAALGWAPPRADGGGQQNWCFRPPPQVAGGHLSQFIRRATSLSRYGRSMSTGVPDGAEGGIPDGAAGSRCDRMPITVWN